MFAQAAELIERVQQQSYPSQKHQELFLSVLRVTQSNQFHMGEILEQVHQLPQWRSYSTEYLRSLLYDLASAGLFNRVARGWYNLLEDTATVGPYAEISRLSGGAVAFQTALYFHGLTDHYPRTYFARTLKTLPSSETKKVVGGVPLIISVTHVANDYHLGLEERRDPVYNRFRITDPEKTFLDLLRHPDKTAIGFTEIMDGIEEYRDDLDLLRLCQYALRLDSMSLLKRVGYILEWIGREDLVQRHQFEQRIGRNWTRLDLSAPSYGFRDRRWLLDVNVDYAYHLERVTAE